VAKNLNATPQYQVYYNIDIMGRKTANITRKTITLQRKEKLTSGKGRSGNITTHCPATHTPLLAITRNKKTGKQFSTQIGYIYSAKWGKIASLVVI